MYTYDNRDPASPPGRGGGIHRANMIHTMQANTYNNNTNDSIIIVILSPGGGRARCSRSWAAWRSCAYKTYYEYDYTIIIIIIIISLPFCYYYYYYY